MSKIKCSFISENSLQTKVYISALELNLNLQDYWTTLKPNSVGSYTKAFFRTKDMDGKEKYYILNNVFITYINDEIIITYRGQFRQYNQIKNPNDFIKENEIKLKELSAQADYYKSCQELSVDTFNKVMIYKLQNEIFITKAITLFNLNPEEKKWEN
ncbi:MSC_0621 family F1-like ATPase epsilon subunit [Mycoplasma sp. Z244C]